MEVPVRSDGGVRRPAGSRTVPALIIGLVLGAILAIAATLGLVALGADPDASATPEDTPAAPATGEVPASCLAAAEYNATVSAALDDVAVGVRDQDALAVEQGLDAIAGIKPDMDAASQECRALAGVDETTDDPTDEPGPTGEPSPTGTP
jgi:hypothetical protein